ncbi:MAG: hypothetical protein ACI35O_04105 [Bacillaceae bacterium]
MTKKMIISAFLSVSLLLTGCSAQEPVDRNELTEKQWEKDIDNMVKSIKKTHEEPFHSISEKKWTNEVDELKKDLPKLSTVETSLRMNQLVSMLHDESTIMDYSTLVGKTSADMIVYPITFDWLEDKLYAIQGTEESKDAIGAELIEINGHKINDVLEQVNTLIPYENVAWAKVNNRIFITLPDVLKFFNIINSDETTYTFKKEDGTNHSVTLKPKKQKDIKFTVDLGKKYREGVTQKMPKDAYGAYWYTYAPEEETFYFQYNQGVFKDEIKGNNKVDLPKFKEFKKQFISDVNDHNIKKFIVDLRRDSSGNPERMKALIKALKEETSVLKDAKVYVLIGYNTFGTGVDDAIEWKEETNATLVGESTGGQTTRYGKPSGFRLPSSQIILQVATTQVKHEGYTGPLKPDVEVKQSRSQFEKGTDELFEYVIKQ